MISEVTLILKDEDLFFMYSGHLACVHNKFIKIIVILKTPDDGNQRFENRKVYGEKVENRNHDHPSCPQ
jgi:hypothetical protein